ncbi:peptidase [Natronolimnohabitans sp. A-GB9]|uniref:peptidase n=1 Tax=Natronolimnohabitans sp. A-GB9 TaxID=3069757 RepID=UPI0027B089F8|nr:peptidase [Natronolimnohabitans sp. A-GB9]MDQ2052847.1 peptidase [Natronolimnohabitans sp. A-GB9]
MQTHLQKGQYVEKRFRASRDEIEVKEDEDGRKRVRMPISSTAEDRDGDEFSENGLEDLRDQINAGKVPAFLDHGRGSRGGYYGALGIVGTWDDASVETESYDGESVDTLYADFVPTKANEDAEDIVALLEDDMPVGASVGFRIIDYERDRDEGKFIFHSTDLLETSIVGIPSNPLTVNDGVDADAIGAKALGSPEHIRFRSPVDQQPVVPAASAAKRQAPMSGGRTMTGAAGLEPGGYDPEARSLERGRLGPDSDLEETLTDVERRLSDLEQAFPTDSSAVDSADDEKEMTDPDPDNGGGDPADGTSGTDVDELRNDISKLTETVGQLADTTNDLVETIDEEHNTEPDETDSDPDVDGTDASDDKDGEPDEEALRLFLSEDADEDVRKEFEALREKANDDGELELAKSETRLFGSDDDGTDGTTDDSTTEVTI